MQVFADFQFERLEATGIYTPLYRKLVLRGWDGEMMGAWDEMDPECPAFLRRAFGV